MKNFWAKLLVITLTLPFVLSIELISSPIRFLDLIVKDYQDILEPLR